MKLSLCLTNAFLLFSVLLSHQTTCFAETNFPTKTIKLIVPFPAGGGTDAVARIVTQKITDEFNASIIVENKIGAGGSVATEFVARSPSDGYTLLFTTSGHCIQPHLQKVNWNPIKDFTPISLVGSYGLLMVVNPSVPGKNLTDFIDHVKKNPGKLNYATSGVGSGLHFAGELFKSMANVDMVHIPYKGSGPGMQDVIAGTCQVIFDGGAKPFVDAGKVRLLGTTSAKRDPRYPNMPTLAEAGLSGYDLTYWIGLFGPKGLAKDVQMKLNAAVKIAVADPQVQLKLNNMGLNLMGSTPEELVADIRQETEKLRAIAATIPGGVQ